MPTLNRNEVRKLMKRAEDDCLESWREWAAADAKGSPDREYLARRNADRNREYLDLLTWFIGP